MDIALTENDDGGGVIAHTLDCPVVQQYRKDDRPIANLYDVKQPLAPNLAQHSCLKAK